MSLRYHLELKIYIINGHFSSNYDALKQVNTPSVVHTTK